MIKPPSFLLHVTKEAAPFFPALQVPQVTESSHNQLGACAVVDATARPQGVSSAGEATTSLESSEQKPVLVKQDSESVSDGAQCLELTSPVSQTSTADTPSSADNG